MFIVNIDTHYLHVELGPNEHRIIAAGRSWRPRETTTAPTGAMEGISLLIEVLWWHQDIGSTVGK